MNELTEEQSKFVQHDGDAFLIACPGAGKTKAITFRIDRLLKNAPARRGVAVLSFTNSAVEEIKNRCLSIGVERANYSPSVISTFDFFLNKFLFFPLFVGGCEVKPNIVDSWKSYDIEVRLSGSFSFKGEGISLDIFNDLGGIDDIDKIRNVGLRQHFVKNRKRYENAARQRVRGLNNKGYFSVSQVRSRVINLLNDDVSRHEITTLLKSRFIELIVDEAQDCNETDIQIINLLKEAGVTISVVCDPNQAIYSFRAGSNSSVPIRRFFRSQSESSIFRLTGNFRSSDVICRAASLQKCGEKPDIAVGPNASIGIPVYLISYGGRSVTEEVGRKFKDIVVQHDINPNECPILSHRRDDAHRAVGYQVNSSGTSKLGVLAQATKAYHSDLSSRQSLMKAIGNVEHLVFEYSTGMTLDQLDLQTVLHDEEDAKQELRRQAVYILDNLNPSCDQQESDLEDWIETARSLFTALPKHADSKKSVKQYLRKPPKDDWATVLQSGGSLGLSASTIHEAKGREFEGVCVVLRPDWGGNDYTTDLIDSFGTNAESEARRVLFVGSTRSKKLLAYAIPSKNSDQMRASLESVGVEYRLIELD